MVTSDTSKPSVMEDEKLLQDLSSCSGERRLKALSELSRLDNNSKNFYKLCLKAEEMTICPTNFREKLCLLQQLSPIKLKSLECEQYSKVAIRFLFGSLFVNFTPLWKEISSLIESFAAVDKEYLGFIIREKIDECHGRLISQCDPVVSEEREPTVDDVKRNRPDFTSYRLNLLAILEKVTFIVEKFGDWFLNSFFDAIGDEVGKPKMTLKEVERRDSKTVIAYLRVMANISNINNLKSINELKLILDQFLVSTNSGIQEAAFNVCAVIYSKSLKKYKAYFLRVIDDKSFKEQLLELNINAVNKDDRKILDDDRAIVIPFLFKILTGKMTSTTSQKYIKSSQDKKDIIMRFIAGCPAEEINLFFDLNLLGLKLCVDESFSTLIEIWSNPGNHKGFPIGKMKESLHFLNLTLTHFVNITQEMLPTVFKYFAMIAVYSKVKANDSRSDAKELKKNCIKMLVTLFQEYDHYSFCDDEVHVMFVSLISPSLDTFQIDSIGNSTPLLQLFFTWSENSKFFHLLSYKQGMQWSPFEVLMKVFENEKTSLVVEDTITKIIANLLQLDSVVHMDEESDSAGIDLIKPFVSLILNKFQFKFERMKKKKKFKIQAQELLIVRYLVDLVENAENCTSLCLLLLEIFRRQHSSSIDSHQEILGTIYSLSQRSSNKSSLIRAIAPLLSQVSPNESRTLICNIVKDIAEPGSFNIVQGLCLINSFSPKYVEEPDYEKRLEGYRSLEKIVQNICNDEEFLLLLECVIYSCIYMLQFFVLDMSLRESSSSLIEKIVITCCASNDKVLFQRICEHTIVSKGVKQLMMCENEAVRMEAVTVLIPVLTHGKGFSPDIDKLSKLQDDNEPEVDFWLNVKHVQAHRRARAFMRLSADHNLLSDLGSQILWSFILPLPLANLKIVDNAKVGPNSASIELIGSICRFLEWNRYESLLKTFLKRLQSESDNLNVLVRVISAILSNFNFDLSQAKLEDGDDAQTDLIDTKLENNDDGNVVQIDMCGQENSLLQKMDTIKASTVLKSITSHLLPSLNKCLYELNYSDFDHDRMKKEFNEEDQVQRIPIAIAVVKLLLVLPPQFKLLENNIQSIFLRLCHFLKSKAVSIRDVARKSLKAVMKDLGISYLPFLLKEMNHTLVRGYQRHVLSYSVHEIVSSLLPSLEPGDLDTSYELLCSICLSNIMGELAQEKEVDKIVGKTKEAKKNKSFDLLHIMALLSTPQTIPILVSPLRQKLLEARIYKDIKRVSDSLHKLFTGFLENTSLPVDKLLTLVYGIASETVLESKTKQQVLQGGNNEKKVIKASRLRQDSLLIGKQLNAPKKAKSTGGNQYWHVLVVKSFHLLQSLLDKNRLKRDLPEHLALLDPFVPLMNEYLVSKQTSVIASVLKCLHHLILDFPNLPSFTSHGNVIKNRLFLLVSRNNATGAREGENEDVSNWCFKTIGVLIKGFDSAEIDDDQLKVLLCHIESGLIGTCNRASTFILLKSILTRRLETPILPSLMERVSQLAIQSEVDHVRKHCWQSWLKYLLFYPHGKKFNTHLLFWIKQLEYEYESGRMSALELIHGLVKNLPQKLLHNHQHTFLIPLSCLLVNEDSIKCKNKVNEVILELISRISPEKRSDIFKQLVIPWMSQMDIRQRQVSVHIMSIFVEVEGQKFEQRLSAFMPLFQQQLDPSRYSQQERGKQVDHFVFSCLSLFHKMMVTLSPGHTSPADAADSRCGQRREKERNFTFSKESPFNDLWTHVESFYLKYPHIWVRFMSAKLFGHLFSGFSHQEVAERIMQRRQEEEEEEEEMFQEDVEEGESRTELQVMKGEKLKGRKSRMKRKEQEEEEEEEKEGVNGKNGTEMEEEEKKEFLLSKPWLTLPSLSRSFFSLFEHVHDLQDFPEQLLQNLEFVTDVIVYLHLKLGKSAGPASPDTSSYRCIPRGLKLESLLWNIRQRIRREMKIAPHETLTRLTMFKLMAKIASSLDAKSLEFHAEQLILPLFREVSDTSSNRDNESHQRLVTLAQQVLDVIETILGPDSFRTNYTKAQVTLQRMRIERKKLRALTVRHFHISSHFAIFLNHAIVE